MGPSSKAGLKLLVSILLRYGRQRFLHDLFPILYVSYLLSREQPKAFSQSAKKIGLSRPIPELFQGVAWSTDTVLTQTLRIADELGLRVSGLEVLGDVDRPEDLARVPAELLEGITR